MKGTHAHSWVMSFESELEAFASYAAAMPNNCLFLVDTYDTLSGVQHAVEVGRRLRELGHELVGIRLDSGDLAYLSIEARRILDVGGFPQAVIVASNDLDETIIESLKHQGAKIAVWGVGTKLATAYDQPALGGVYKLGAIRDDDGQWQPKMKLSAQSLKRSIPGILQVRRFTTTDSFVADMIYDEQLGWWPADRPSSHSAGSVGPLPDNLGSQADLDRTARSPVIVDLQDANRRRRMPSDTASHDLLVPVLRAGELQERFQDPTRESMEVARSRAREQLHCLHPTIRRLLNPHEYPVGIEQGLHERRDALIRQLRAEPEIED